MQGKGEGGCLTRDLTEYDQPRPPQLGKAQCILDMVKGGKWVSKTRRKMIRVTLRDPALWGPLWVLRRLRFPVMVVRGLGVGTMT